MVVKGVYIEKRLTSLKLGINLVSSSEILNLACILYFGISTNFSISHSIFTVQKRQTTF